ncbi:unnamed protein product, partial [Meganyctiphanes norvegica]
MTGVPCPSKMLWCYSIIIILLVKGSHQQEDLCSQTLLDNLSHIMNARLETLNIRMNNIASTLNSNNQEIIVKISQLLEEKLSNNMENKLSQLLEEKLSSHLEDKLSPLLEEKLTSHLEEKLSPLLEEKLSSHLEENISPLLENKLSSHIEDKLSPLLEKKLSSHIEDKLSPLLEKNLSSLVENQLSPLLEDKLSRHLEEKLPQHLDEELYNISETINQINSTLQHVVVKQDIRTQEIMEKLTNLETKQSDYIQSDLNAVNNTLIFMALTLEGIEEKLTSIKNVTEKIELEAVVSGETLNSTSVFLQN